MNIISYNIQRDMDKLNENAISGTETILYPSHRCKTLHLVRHAQGIHNVASEINHDLLSSYDYFDASLSPLGWNQVDDLRKRVQDSGLSKRIDLVITSSLLRTMQTAVGAFGGSEEMNEEIENETPYLMVKNVGNSNRPPITTLNSPPFISVETCRERLGVHPCDKRRSVEEYKSLFPAIDFSQIESNEDILWKPDVRENNQELAARGLKFINWLWTLKEKEIAIVTHSGFLSETLKALATHGDPSLKNEISTQFSNCELRTVVIVDRSFKESPQVL